MYNLSILIDFNFEIVAGLAFVASSLQAVAAGAWLFRLTKPENLKDVLNSLFYGICNYLDK